MRRDTKRIQLLLDSLNDVAFGLFAEISGLIEYPV